MKITYQKILRKSEEGFKNFEINFEDDFEQNLSKIWTNFENFWKKYILRIFKKINFTVNIVEKFDEKFKTTA